MKFVPTLLSTEEMYEGQPGRLYRFRNGYGASVVGDDRCGWNIAVVRFTHLDPEKAYRWDDRSDLLMIDTTTSVTDDVVRIDDPDDSYTEGVLDAIAKLEKY